MPTATNPPLAPRPTPTTTGHSFCTYATGTLILLWTVIVSLLLAKFSVHFVEEGHVGIYYRSGRLLDTITSPGLHFKYPFIDTFESVQVTLQTDRVTNIPCGTAGGVVINFGQIEVVNRLRTHYVLETIRNYTSNYDKVMIFDRVHHLINQFCSSHTLQEIYIDLFSTVDDELAKELQADANKWCPGLEIISVRVTKPILPAVILANYESMEAEKTKLLIANQKQLVEEKLAETEKRKAVIQAEKEAAVSLINLNQKIQEKLTAATIAQIENEMLHNKSKARTDALSYHRYKEALVNERLLTPSYLSLQAIENLAKTTRVYFGPSVPSTFIDLGTLLTSMEKDKGSSHGTMENSKSDGDTQRPWEALLFGGKEDGIHHYQPPHPPTESQGSNPTSIAVTDDGRQQELPKYGRMYRNSNNEAEQQEF